MGASAFGGAKDDGKRILRDMLFEEFKEWDVDKFAETLVLRSLRGVAGVWRLLVWEQAQDMNSECFSCLGSWSFRTRIPQRTLTQLYGTMCGILESIHQVRAPPAQWAELEVLLRAAVRDGDTRGWRHSSCVHVSTGQIEVFFGFWGSSVLQSWALLYEKSD